MLNTPDEKVDSSGKKDRRNKNDRTYIIKNKFKSLFSEHVKNSQSVELTHNIVEDVSQSKEKTWTRWTSRIRNEVMDEDQNDEDFKSPMKSTYFSKLDNKFGQRKETIWTKTRKSMFVTPNQKD